MSAPGSARRECIGNRLTGAREYTSFGSDIAGSGICDLQGVVSIAPIIVIHPPLHGYDVGILEPDQ